MESYTSKLWWAWLPSTSWADFPVAKCAVIIWLEDGGCTNQYKNDAKIVIVLVYKAFRITTFVKYEFIVFICLGFVYII